MSDVDVYFCRSVLKSIHLDVKKHFPKLNLKTSAWTYHFSRGNWEFHGPDKFYWYGSAANAYDARCQGWMAFLQSKGFGDAV